MQTAVPVRSSIRSLENAMQGQPINLMAPSHQFHDEDLESQIPPWVSAETQAHQPSFTLSQPGDQFGFKLPSVSGLENSGGTVQSAQMPSSIQGHTR